MQFPGIINKRKLTFHFCQAEMRSLPLTQLLCPSVPQTISIFYNSISFFLLLFKYSCLHFHPTTAPRPTQYNSISAPSLWGLFLPAGPSYHQTIPGVILNQWDIGGISWHRLRKHCNKRIASHVWEVLAPNLDVYLWQSHGLGSWVRQAQTTRF